MLQHHGNYTGYIFLSQIKKNNSDNPNDVKLDDFRYVQVQNLRVLRLK